jgi:hypothetical protein
MNLLILLLIPTVCVLNPNDIMYHVSEFYEPVTSVGCMLFRQNETTDDRLVAVPRLQCIDNCQYEWSEIYLDWQGSQCLGHLNLHWAYTVEYSVKCHHQMGRESFIVPSSCYVKYSNITYGGFTLYDIVLGIVFTTIVVLYLKTFTFHSLA